MPDKPENPQAFPFVTQRGSKTTMYPGATLRDYFAGQAMAGDLVEGGWGMDEGTCLAERSYAFADAMLAERAKNAT